MIPLASKPNVDSPNLAYPFGKIRDKAGVTPGTPISTVVYGDFHQFFEKMMALSGVTANGNPDNETNGFQLIEAMQRMPGLVVTQAQMGVVFDVTKVSVGSLVGYLHGKIFTVRGLIVIVNAMTAISQVILTSTAINNTYKNLDGSEASTPTRNGLDYNQTGVVTIGRDNSGNNGHITLDASRNIAAGAEFRFCLTYIIS